MNGSIFWRLVWKEHRVLRGLWLAMAALALLLELAIVVISRLVAEPVDLQSLFGPAFGFTAFYGLGCGAVLFATEHETGTWGFLNSLPVSAARVLAAKAAFAVFSTGALIGLLWLSALALASGSVPPRDIHLAIWGTWGFAAIELLLWGTLFSLLSTQPLRAAILAAAAASVVTHVVVSGFGITWELDAYVRALPVRAAVAAVVAAADLGLALRWLRPEMARPGRRAIRTEIDKPPGRWYARSPGRAVLRRLVWQHWRQSWRLMAVLGLLAAPALLLTTCDAWNDEFPRLLRPTSEGLGVLAGIVGWAVPCLIGAGVFVADRQGHGFRFLAERGAGPALVWLSRHLVWVPLAAAGLAATLLLVPRPPASPRTTLEEFPYAAGVVVFFLLAYAAGQFWSMLLRSGILAGFFAIFSTALLWGWAWLTWRLGVGWWWSVAPIPLVLMLGTWLHSGDWLLERGGRWVWLRVWLPVALVAVLLLGAFPLVRVYEVPDVEPGFAIEGIAREPTAEEEATRLLYEPACRQFVGWDELLRSRGSDKEYDPDKVRAMEDTCSPERRAWVEANEAALAAVAEAGRKPAPWFSTQGDPSWNVNVMVYLHDFGRLLLERAAQRTADGDLDGAWADLLAALRVSVHMRRSLDRYIEPDALETQTCAGLADWAARPGQSPELLRKALGQYQALLATIPSPEGPLKKNYLLNRQVLAESDTRLRARWRPDAWFRAAVDAGWMPWEKARAWRVLNLTTAQDFAALQEVQRALAEGRPAAAPSGEFVLRQQRLWDTTPALSPWFWPEGHSLIARYLRMVTRRRAATLLLALEAWKARHGRFPDTLDELVGTYLDRLPLDPYSGKPFLYHFDCERGCAAIESAVPGEYVQRDGHWWWYYRCGFGDNMRGTGASEESVAALRQRPGWTFLIR